MGRRTRSRSLSVGSANSSSSRGRASLNTRPTRKRSGSVGDQNQKQTPNLAENVESEHTRLKLDANVTEDKDAASKLKAQQGESDGEDKGSALGISSETPTNKKKRTMSESSLRENSNVSISEVAENDEKMITEVDSKLEDAENRRGEKPDLPVKRAPTLDVIVHRMRHLNYLPSSIVCMRATPIKSKYDCLAIARADGSVELRSVAHKFRTLATVAGKPGKEVNAMAWVMPPGDAESDAPVLIGGSQDGSLFVVDFKSLRIIDVTSSGGGGVFALESLYESSGGDETSGASSVAAACEDGSIRIFQLTSDMGLSLASTIPTTGAAVLSLAWRRMEKTTSSDAFSGTVAFAGVADGTIRTFTYSKGDKSKRSTWKSGHRMTAESLGRRIPTRIWSLKLLSDWTLISSDSLGNVQFWDGKTGSLEQTFQQSEQKADVLDIDVSSNECHVFASGVDSRVVHLERPSKDGTDESRRWVLSHAYRPHTHDVKSVVICYAENTSSEDSSSEPKRSFLCTGGIDMKLCTYLADKFNQRRPRTLYPWPDDSPVFLSKKSHVFAIVKNAKVEIHKHHQRQRVLTPVTQEESTLLGTFEMKTQSNLRCGAFSDDGKLMAVCDSASVYVLRLDQENYTPSRIPITGKLRSAVSSISFLGNQTILISASDGKLLVLEHKVQDGKERFVLKQSLSSEMGVEKRKSQRLPARSMALSLDSGKWLATLSDEYDGGSSVDIHFVEGNKYRHWWTLPKQSNPITAMSFVGEGSNTKLVVGCINYDVLVFDVGLRKVDAWSCKSGGDVINPVEREMAHRSDYPLQVCIHPSTEGKAILRSTGVFLVVDLLQPPPAICRTVPERHVRRKKRKRSNSLGYADDVEGPEAIQCLRYNSMLFMGYSDKKELVVVEQPWLDVVATLPEAMQRRLYGA